MLASLNQFLARPSQSQKISWRVQVAEDAHGHHDLILISREGEPTKLTLALGTDYPPVSIKTLPEAGPVLSLKAIYPRALQKNLVWSPTGTTKDFG